MSNPTQSKHTAFVILIAVIAALGGILFGYDTGVISGAILFIRKQFELTNFTNGLVVSSVLLGALFGAVIGGRLADYYGRRKMLIVTALVFIVGTLASASAQSMIWLALSRVVVGLAIGVASFVVPLYISEISPVKYRGALVSLNQLAITVGILVSYLVDYVFVSTDGWRWMMAFGVIPASLLFIGMLFLPSSPHWMILKGLDTRALEVLSKTRQADRVQQEFHHIKKSLAKQKGDWHMLAQKWLRPAITIGLGLAFFQQVTGINTIIYYAPTIFMIAGFQSAAATLATIGVGIVVVLFTIIAIPLVDRWGRRPLLLLGITTMIISLGILSIAFFKGGHTLGIKWIALGSMLFYIMGFAISLGPIMWLIIAEVFPLEIRGLGSSLCVAASWGFNMIVALTFLTLIDIFKPGGTFLLYCLISIAGLIFIYFRIPETKGVPLETIEVNLREGKPSRELGRVVK